MKQNRFFVVTIEMFTCSVFLLWLDKSVECLLKVDRLIARERARLKEEKKKELDEVERLIAKEREENEEASDQTNVRNAG